MSASKHFNKIAWSVTAFVLIITILFMNGTVLGIEAAKRTLGYENRLFDNTRVHTLDIVMNNFDEFIKNARSEEYYTANLVIDGEAYKNVAIRGKGNTSLSSVSSMGSERYSFKVEFDHYDSSMTYHGLDKLSLNNLIQDSTMMKDYLTYTMMNEFGAPSPLCSFVYITVNGEDWGLYLAVEGIEDSFIRRNFGTDSGELYKPDSMSFGGGRGNGKDFNMNDFAGNLGGFNMGNKNGASNEKMSISKMSETSGNKSTERKDNFSFGGMGGFGGMGSSDVKLQYIDDNADSYSNIWNNAKTDITDEDKTRLISSLKKLSEKTDLENTVDIENVIRYFVVHNFVCNGDSYTGGMVHNYYLYEKDGKLSMLPWDYNLAFGTFQGGNAASTVNTPIDAPVSGGSGNDRPMWYWILSDEGYTEMYHKYFEEFLSTVDIQSIIQNAYNLIKPYVEKDPTAFYTPEEFEKGVSAISEFCSLRSESISLQLENGKTESNMSYVDASSLNISDMGSMGGGKGGFGGSMARPDSFGGRTNTSDTSKAEDKAVSDTPASQPQMQGGFDMSQMPEGFDPSQMPQGGFDMSQMPEGFDPSQMQGGFDMSQMPEGGFDMSQMPGGGFGGFGNRTEQGNEGESSENKQAPSAGGNNRPARDNMQFPGNSFSTTANPQNAPTEDYSNMIWFFSTLGILALGLIIAKLYRY